MVSMSGLLVLVSLAEAARLPGIERSGGMWPVAGGLQLLAMCYVILAM